MPTQRIIGPHAASLAAVVDLDALRAELDIPHEFPAAALAEAADIVSAAPPVAGAGVLDALDVPFVTIDPPGSLDLDQAVHLEDLGAGRHRVRYAIADLGSAIPVGGALEAESLLRGQTFYCPDRREPPYPPELSEGAISLLPDQVRRAVLWTIELDADGLPESTTVTRCVIRSVARLDYPSVQAEIDAGRGVHPSIAALEVIGRQRLAAARARHAITLDLPDVEVEQDEQHRWELRLRAMTPVEQWNAEISLLAGTAAAQIMLDGGSGVLRTLPEPDAHAVRRLRSETAALGIDWPDGTAPGDVIAGLRGDRPRDAAFLADAVTLLRGAGYRAFAGGAPPQEETGHAGVGAPYAHVTAPLRRLVDRFATEYCLAHAAGVEVPSWVTSQIDAVVETMQRTDRQAHALDRRIVSAVAGTLLHDRIGDELDGVVTQIDGDRDKASVTLADPPVQARAAADGLTEGTRVRVRLVSADSDGIVVAPIG